MSAFAKYETKNYPFRFAVSAHVATIVGGTPTDPNVAKAWLNTKVTEADDIIQAEVATVMAERGVKLDEALAEVVSKKHLNGFKRDEQGLYIEGRQMKACIKEGANIAMSVGKLPRKWGQTSKGILGFVSEHIFVVEDRIYLGTAQPTGILQRFITTFRGTGIQYEEYVEDAKLSFTVESDYDFSEAEWAALWLTCERQGIGASRSQGYGRFTVEQWDRLA